MSVYLVLFAASILAVIGQVLFKLGTAGGTLMKVIWSPHLWCGVICYFLSMVLWLYSLSKVRLGVAYGFTCLTFVGVYMASFILFKEPVSAPKIIAILLIVAGFLMLTKWA